MDARLLVPAATVRVRTAFGLCSPAGLRSAVFLPVDGSVSISIDSREILLESVRGFLFGNFAVVVFVESLKEALDSLVALRASSGFGRGPMAGKLLADYIHTGHPAPVLAESDPARCITLN